MYTTEEIIKRFKEIHTSKYDYSKVEFIKTSEKVIIICPEHGEFKQTPQAHLKGQGCPKCALNKRIKSKTKNIDKFIVDAKLIHGDKYDYNNVIYKNNKIKVKIYCPIHGIFEQTPHGHLSGNGCPKCANEKRFLYNKLNINSFIKKAKEVHGDKYDYSKVKYINNKTKVCIICPKHGEFEQSPQVHINGFNCPKCGIENRIIKNTKTTEQFIKDAIKIHGNRYDYSKVDYNGFNRNVIILCKEHGEFEQKPLNHLNGCGCQKCGTLYSTYENEIYNYISTLIPKNKIIQNDRKILNGNELDIFIPSMNLAFEFDGLYWHSEIQKPNKRYHLNKTEECEKQGIQLIHIFEDEWLNKKDICKSRIKNLLGFSDKIYGRKCKIVELNKKQAKIFFENNHIQGNINSKIIYGLEYNGEIVSAMSFGGLRKNMGSHKSEGSYELLRFCNKINISVIGGASKLYDHFINKFKPNEVISYVDRRWSIGKLYNKLNFNFSHISDPSYFYVINNERKNRFSYRKDILISKYGCSPKDTEHNFCFSKGWYRIYDCGTKVYKWKSTL